MIRTIERSQMEYAGETRDYLLKNASWHQEDSPYKANIVIKMMARHAIKPATIADVGCGAGLVTELLARNFPNAAVAGYDISPDAAMFWPSRSAPNLSYANTDILQEDTVFDLLLTLDVFEHVEDYFGFLRALKPRARYHLFNIPLDMNVLKVLTGLHHARTKVGHLHYFDAYTACETLSDTGYAIVDSFISNATRGTAPRNLRQAIVAGPRLIASTLLGDRISAKLMGGSSLVVLTR